MLVSFLAHSILATNPPVADPTCHTGIGYYNYCCAKSCGLCGGWHCDQRDGGAKACCTTNIRTDSMQCSTQGPSTEFGGCMLASSSCADTLAQKNPSAKDCSYYVSHGKCAEPWIRDGCAFSCGNCPSTGGQGAWFIGISDIRVAGAKQPPYDQTNPTAAYATFNALSHTKQAMRGVSMYVDQPASKFGAMPSELYRLNGISTKAADWNRGFNNPQFLCFTIDQEAVVYILYDRKLVDTTHGYPKWLTDTFTDRHTQTVENVAGESYFEVFAKWFPRGKVCLGGNFQQRKATDVMSMYIPLVGPPLPQYVPTNDITGIISFYADSFPRWSGCTTESQDKTGRKTSGGCVTTGLAYEIAPMMRGSAYYLDRSYTFKDLPDWMSGLNGLRTRNDYHAKGGGVAKWVEIELSAPSAVFVLFDRRATAYPAWLTSQFFDKHVEVVETTDRNAGHFEVFYGLFNGTLTLGGPAAPGALSHYVVLFADEQAYERAQAVKYTVTISNVAYGSGSKGCVPTTAIFATGRTLYADREYAITNAPEELDGMTMLKTCEKDKHSVAQVKDFLCFDIDRDATVYVLYMPRAATPPDTQVYYPAWLTSTFKDKHEDTVERIDASEDNRNNFEIFSSYFPAGHVCIGGNEDQEVLPSGWRMYNNYVVVVGPVQKFPDFAVKISRVRHGRATAQTGAQSCATGLISVNHQYDFPGKETCDCVPPNDPCRTTSGPTGVHCLLAPTCGSNPDEVADARVFPCGRSTCIGGDAAVAAKEPATTNDCTTPSNLCPFNEDGKTRMTTCGSNDGTHTGVCRSSIGRDAHQFIYAIQPMQTGAAYYTDRDYVLGVLPDELLNLNGIATPNDDKDSSCAAAGAGSPSFASGACAAGVVNDPEYLCFDVDQQARVYVLYDQRAHANAVAAAVKGGADPASIFSRAGYPNWLQDETTWSDTEMDYVGSTDSGGAEFEVFTQEVKKGTVCLGGNNDWIPSPTNPAMRANLNAACNYIVLVGPPDVDKIYPTLPPTQPSAANAVPGGAFGPQSGGLDVGVIVGIVVATLISVPGTIILIAIIITLLVVFKKPILQKLRDIRTGQTYARGAADVGLGGELGNAAAGGYEAPMLDEAGGMEQRAWQSDGLGDQLSSAFNAMDDDPEEGDVL